jgi:peptidoglycan hydrolase-like protein with peptidoglycan-binding domain
MIQQLQLELKKAGFMDQSVVLSSRYGEKTREAVQKYQQSLSSTSTTLSKPLSEMTREELIRLLLILIIQKYGIH